MPISVYKSILLLSISLSLWTTSSAQDSQVEPISEYISPLDIPLLLSGNFGEIRNNHFHTGIDIKTQGVEGKKLYAVADGYISRINISPSGYGKAIYIDHPNGYTSVYGHMKSFSDSIEDFIKNKQYEVESYKMEFYPNDDRFKVKQGDVIGLSGNTGSSGGPHLHFELRETKSEHPVNPLLFGFEVKDETKPIFKGIRFYPKDNLSYVAGNSKARTYPLKPDANGEYKLLGDAIDVSGDIGIAIYVIDKMLGVSNIFSVHQLKLVVDDDTIYSHHMDELDFETTRYVNCQVDYEIFKKSKWKYQKCFPAKNNKLDIYDGKGEYITLNEGDTKKISVIIMDLDSNQTSFSFTMNGVKSPDRSPVNKPFNQMLDADKDNVFENNDISILFPKGVLYDDMAFNFKEEAMLEGAKTKTFLIGDKKTPLQDNINITIKLKEEDFGNEKIRLYRIGKRKKLKIEESHVMDTVVEAYVKNFGKFLLKEDTKAPVIIAKAFPSAMSSKNSVVFFTFSDNLSGINSIRATVDDKWLMIKHNASMNKGTAYFKDLDLEAGEHKFIIEVKDSCGNSKTFEKTFTWM